ncbi:unnamed protein product [Urochloa humidicola]
MWTAGGGCSARAAAVTAARDGASPELSREGGRAHQNLRGGSGWYEELDEHLLEAAETIGTTAGGDLRTASSGEVLRAKENGSERGEGTGGLLSSLRSFGARSRPRRGDGEGDRQRRRRLGLRNDGGGHGSGFRVWKEVNCGGGGV